MPHFFIVRFIYLIRGDTIFKYYIEKYINNLSIDDVYKYGLENNLCLSKKEADIIYECIKNDWETLIYSNYNVVLDKYKNSFDSDTFNKIEELIILYKEKYKNYIK